jgi:hypothetical protein
MLIDLRDKIEQVVKENPEEIPILLILDEYEMILNIRKKLGNDFISTSDLEQETKLGDPLVRFRSKWHV